MLGHSIWKHMRLHRLLVPILLLLAALAPFALPRSLAHDDDHERRDAVRRALEAGEVLPLSEILNRVRGQIPGDVTGVEIEGGHGRWRYELRLIDRGGRVLDVRVDAHSGAIEHVEER